MEIDERQFIKAKGERSPILRPPPPNHCILKTED